MASGIALGVAKLGPLDDGLGGPESVLGFVSLAFERLADAIHVLLAEQASPRHL